MQPSLVPLIWAMHLLIRAHYAKKSPFIFGPPIMYEAYSDPGPGPTVACTPVRRLAHRVKHETAQTTSFTPFFQ